MSLAIGTPKTIASTMQIAPPKIIDKSQPWSGVIANQRSRHIKQEQNVGKPTLTRIVALDPSRNRPVPADHMRGAGGGACTRLRTSRTILPQPDALNRIEASAETTRNAATIRVGVASELQHFQVRLGMVFLLIGRLDTQ
jgi:hypothetical protein